MSGPVVDVLEVGEAPSRRRARRWWLAGLLLALMVAAVVPPVTRHVARSADRHALARIDFAWAARQATNDALTDLFGILDRWAVPTDARFVATVAAAAQREAADRLTAEVAGLRSARLRSVRDLVRAVLATEAAALRRAAGQGQQVNVDVLVGGPAAERARSLLDRAHERLDARRAVSPQVHLAAAAALSRLDRFLDVPVPMRVLVATGDGTKIVDLMRSRAMPGPTLPPTFDFQRVGDVLIGQNENGVISVPLAGGKPRRLAGPSVGWVRAARGDGVWLSLPNGEVVLVDLHGRRRLAPVRPPGYLAGASDGKLVLGGFDERSLLIWDPSTGRVLRRLGGDCARIVAVAGDVVAWRRCVFTADAVDYPGPLHLTTISTGRDRTVALPYSGPEGASGSFAPDGRHLITVSDSGGGQRLALVDVETGTATTIVGPARSNPIWSPDSRRVFFTAGAADLSTDLLWTFAVGDRASMAIRYIGFAQLTPIAVLPATSPAPTRWGNRLARFGVPPDSTSATPEEDRCPGCDGSRV